MVNLVYTGASKWLVAGAGAELEAADISAEARVRLKFGAPMTETRALERVAEKKKVHLRSITKLGDMFWAYVIQSSRLLRFLNCIPQLYRFECLMWNDLGTLHTPCCVRHQSALFSLLLTMCMFI